MTEEESYQVLIDKALKLLSFRPRSKKELYGKLFQYSVKRGIGKKTIEKVLTDLEEKKLVDDKAFVEWWVDQRDTFRPKAKRVLKDELRQKGIEKEDLDSFFENPDSGRGEYEKALALAQKRYPRVEKLDKREAREKLGAYLARRGFDWSIIGTIIDTLEKKD